MANTTLSQTEIDVLTEELDSCAQQWGTFHPETVSLAHRLALATWRSGEVQQAIHLLDMALHGLTTSLEPQHPVRMNLLGTLGDIFAEQGHWEPASVIYDELLKSRADSLGPGDPQTLTAKGDLVIALFELGKIDEACRLESQAIEEAHAHLGECHSVTTVLAWNRALRYESQGNEDRLQTVLRNELSWLLLRDARDLSPDQMNIRAMLARRLSVDLQAVSPHATYVL